MKQKGKKQNGVTLIALVVTIVILLILVAVSIATITGENGIVAKAQEAAQKTKDANEEENRQLEEIENIMNEQAGKPSWKGEVNQDTNGDGKPDINIDTNGDGKPNVNIDTTGDKKPNVNVDTNGDGKPNINIDTNGDYKPDINIDTNGDNKPDVNIDTDDDQKPNLNIDTNGDGKPDLNIDTDGDGNPDLNIDTDGDGKPDVNIDTNGDGEPDINIDTDGDGEPDKNIEGTDINVDTNGDGEPDINIDTDGDGKPDVNVDTNGDGKPDLNIDTDGDGKPDVNVDTNGDGKPDINIDTDGDREPDINIDTDGDGEPDINIDTNGDGEPDVNIDKDGDGKPDVNIDTDGDGEPDVNIDTDGDGEPDKNVDGKDINVDTNGDGKPDLNIDTNGDGKPDVNIDTDGDGNPDINIDKDGDGTPDLNIDTDGDGKPDVNIDTNGDGEPDINVDTDGDGEPDENVEGKDINIDTDGDGEPDVNIDTDGDGKPDINIDKDGDKIPDVNIDTDGDGEPDVNIDTDGDGEPDLNIDTDGDGKPDINVDTNGDGTPDEDIDTNGDGIPDENITAVAIVEEPTEIETIATTKDISFNIGITGSGDIRYQWYYNTSDSTTGGTAINGATSNRYTIATNEVTSSLSGRYYYCVVTQEYRNKTKTVTSHTAKLTVVSPVTITIEPTAKQVIAGKASVSFNVEATGAGNVSYQWYYNTSNSTEGGTKLEGVTENTYTIVAENVTTALNGRYYYCVATQNYGNATTTITSSTALLSVASPVAITTHPAAVTVTPGNNATFTVVVNAIGTLSYQWYVNNTNNTTGGTAITGATSSSYSINSVSSSDNNKYYYCVVTQNYGETTASATSATVVLTVGNKVSVSNPSDVSVIERKTEVTYAVTATGSGTFEYQWYQNNSNSNSGGTAISGATSSTYTIAATDVTTSLNEKYYYCVVKQKYGNLTETVASNVAKLNVVAMTTITSQPAEVSVIAGKTAASFSMVASGEGIKTYQWYQNSSNSNSGGTAIDGATGENYTIVASNVTTSLNGKYYYCVVTQRYGSSTATTTSNVAKLNVITGTTITSHPTEVNAIAGKTAASFSITASGEGTKTYQWYQNSSNSNSGGTVIDGATSSTYTIEAGSVTTSLNGKYYYCMVTQSYGSSTTTATSNVAKLNVVAGVTITSQPVAVNVMAGRGDASFTVATSGGGTLKYQWYSNTTNSNTAGTAISGATSSTYTIAAANVDTHLDGMYYYCEITQTYESATATVNSNTARLGVGAIVSISTQPTDITIMEGDYGYLIVNASGGGDIKYQWYAQQNQQTGYGTAIEGATNNSYQIAGNSNNNGRYYYCVVTQSYGGVTSEVKSNSAKVTVVTPVTITSQPTAVNVIAGKNSVSYTVATSGSGEISYQWYQNSSNSNEGGTAISGATGSTYTIVASNVTTSLSGKYYYCVATQSYGGITRTAKSNAVGLSVVSPVTITNQPVAITVNEESSATFSVTANGSGTLSYQWYYQTSTTAPITISGATGNSYTISKTNTDMNQKQYLCIVTQKYGSSTAQVTSNKAILTVNVRADGAFVSSKNVNSPKLASGMTIVYWNANRTEQTLSSTSSVGSSNWYDYVAGDNSTDTRTSHWANAKTSDGSYWVWIPRYEYKILSGEGTSRAGKIEVKFIPTTQTTADAGYKIHPAFQNGTSNNFKNGEWDKELDGIWVAKYEASHSNATASSEGNSTTIRIKPGVVSWRNISIGDSYTKAYNYDRNKESHLMKNSEWGAVAYLAQSQYGRNGHEIDINNSSSFITGNGGGSTSASKATGVTNAYYTEIGTKASTTGNIYGIYDLSGGSIERLAAYITNGNSSLSDGSSFVKQTNADANGYKTLSTKYATVYPYNSANDTKTNNYATYKEAGYGYGDAILETSTSGGSWFSDSAKFPYEGFPFFRRGDVYDSGSGAGVFSFFYAPGYEDGFSSFRPVLAF